MHERNNSGTTSRSGPSAAEPRGTAAASRSDARLPATIRDSAFYEAMISDLAWMGMLRCRANVDGR